MEIHTRPKLCPFGRYVAKVKLFCLKMFRSVTRAGVFIRENFHPSYRKISASASHMAPRFLRMEEWRGEISETEPAQLPGLK